MPSDSKETTALANCARILALICVLVVICSGGDPSTLGTILVGL